MSERPEEPKAASDADSLLPVDEHVEEGHDAEAEKSGIVVSICCQTFSLRRTCSLVSTPSSTQ